MTDKGKTTAPVSSVGADEEQSFADNNSITDNAEKSNDYFDEWQREMLRTMDPSYLRTVSMSELYDTVYRSKPPLIDGLLYPGTYLFVGAPKLGKSFFMAQLAYHISTGLPLWDYPVRKGAVLYLALEDDYRRLQERLFRMFGTDSAENLHFAISASQLGNGLDKQLQGFIAKYPDTRLIIIDTLQKVREVGGDKFSYANDYEIITRLKQATDSYGICLLLVRHTRKQQSDDKFDMISGTNGLLGAADGAWLLQKEKRTSNSATLDISGRDQQDQRLYLTRDMERLIWRLEKAETELWKEPPDPVIETVAAIVTAENPNWSGTPTELVGTLGLDIPPNVLTKRLNVNAGRLQNEYGVRYENDRTHGGRVIKLVLDGETA
ncbi:MAG: helicase RepA family protein [Clostridiales bacterium]|jgi:RecA-family ATPase|nr:helicase RepA family protein [Clostridiales bacterium]